MQSIRHYGKYMMVEKEENSQGGTESHEETIGDFIFDKVFGSTTEIDRIMVVNLINSAAELYQEYDLDQTKKKIDYAVEKDRETQNILFDKVRNYNQLIILGFFGVFLALWTYLEEIIFSKIMIISGIFVLSSGVIYAVWTVIANFLFNRMVYKIFQQYGKDPSDQNEYLEMYMKVQNTIRAPQVWMQKINFGVTSISLTLALLGVLGLLFEAVIFYLNL